MRINRETLICTILAGLLLAYLIGSEVHNARGIAPKGVGTVADYLRRFGEPRRIRRFQQNGQEYYELTGALPGLMVTATPSSPPAYIFDISGKFVSWCSDPGDIPSFRNCWPMTNAQPVDPAAFRRQFDH